MPNKSSVLGRRPLWILTSYQHNQMQPLTLDPGCPSFHLMILSVGRQGCRWQIATPRALPPYQLSASLLTAHKGERVRELIEGKGCELLTCHPTHQTSIPSKKLSQRSRVFYAGLAPGRKKRW